MRVFSIFHPKKPQELIDVFVDEPIPFADAQAAFRHWSAQDKLEWLEAINRLYWAAVRANRTDGAI